MKKIISIFLAVIVAVGAFSLTFVASATDGLLISPAPTAQRIFTDIEPGSALEASLVKLKNAGIINGYEDGSFQPYGGLTRAEFCKMINILFGYTVPATTEFPDVSYDKWYYVHVLIAKQQGYIKGFEDGTFRPNEKITREQVCVILDRINNCYKLYDVAISDEVSDWARESVVKVISNGLMPLEEGNTFRAKQIITRAEFAAVFVPFLDARAELEAGNQGTGTSTGTGTGTGTGSSRPSGGSPSGGAPSGGAPSGGSPSGGTPSTPSDPDDGKDDGKDDNEQGGTVTPPAEGGDDNEGGTTNPPAEGGDDNEGGNTNPPAEGGDDNEGGTTNPPAEGGDDNEGGNTNPPTAGGDDNEGGNTNPPAGGDDNEGGNTNPPAGGDDNEGGTTNPPAEGGDDNEGGNTNPPAGGDDNEGGNTNPPAGGDDDEGGNTNPPAGGDDDEDDPVVTPPAGGDDDEDDPVVTPPAGGDDDEDEEEEIDMTEDDIVISELEKLIADLDSRKRFTHSREFGPFFTKVKNVLKSVVNDSKTTLITPEYVSEVYGEQMESVKAEYYTLCDDCVADFNTIVNDCSTKYKAVLVEYFYDIIPEEAFDMLG